MRYIRDRAATPGPVVVAIMNRRHKGDALELRRFCEAKRLRAPRFIAGASQNHNACYH